MPVREHIYHLDKSIKVHENVILVGKKKRAMKIVEYLTDGMNVYDEELAVYNGKYEDLDISVAFCGIGPSSVSIAFQELVGLGARNFIRVGTCGKLLENMKIGDICVVHGAVRNDGVSGKIAPIQYPAVASPSLIQAIANTIRGQGKQILENFEESDEDCAIYMTVADTKVEFFTEIPEFTADRKRTGAEWEELIRMGVAVSSMECATIYVKANFLQNMLHEKISAASILVIVGDTIAGNTLYAKDEEDLERIAKGEELAIKIALDSIKNYNKE